MSAAEVRTAGNEHAVDVTRHLRAPCLGMYRRYLEHCFVDRKLSDDEVEDLAHLRAILCLADSACVPLHHDGRLESWHVTVRGTLPRAR